MKDLIRLFRVGMLLASGVTSYASLRQPTSNNWYRQEDEDSPHFPQPGTVLMVGSTCILHHSSTPVQTASFPSFSVYLKITSKNLSASILKLVSLSTTSCAQKLMYLKKRSALLYFLTLFSILLWPCLEITFSLAKWDHRPVKSENPLTLSTFSIFEMWHHSSYDAFFGFHHAVLFESFCLNCSHSYLHWHFLLPTPHMKALFRFTPSSSSNFKQPVCNFSVIILRTQSALETFVGQWE